MSKDAKSTQPKPRLGRGLSSLIGNPNELTQPDSETEYQPVTSNLPAEPAREINTPAIGANEIPADQISPNPYQPRKDFAEAELMQLAESIRQQGILQPLVVSLAKPGSKTPYVLIAGERRLRAARQAGLDAVPCVVREASRQQTLEWALVENIQRADLNPVERANAYRSFMDRFGLSQADAAERLGQPRATIANHVRLLELNEDVQKMLSSGTLTFGHGKVLAGIVGRTKLQLAMALRVIAKGLSVRDLEGMVDREKPEDGKDRRGRKRRAKAPYVVDLEERLSQAIGTRTTIVPGRNSHTGRIVVEYYSLDDFDRITAALGLREDS